MAKLRTTAKRDIIALCFVLLSMVSSLPLFAFDEQGPLLIGKTEASTDTVKYYAVQQKGLWGLVKADEITEKKPKFVVKPQYTAIGKPMFYAKGNTCTTILPVQHKGKWGFIDYSGKILLKPEYDNIVCPIKDKGDFSYWHVTQNGKSILTDINGAPVIACNKVYEKIIPVEASKNNDIIFEGCIGVTNGEAEIGNTSLKSRNSEWNTYTLGDYIVLVNTDFGNKYYYIYTQEGEPINNWVTVNTSYFIVKDDNGFKYYTPDDNWSPYYSSGFYYGTQGSIILSGAEDAPSLILREENEKIYNADNINVEKVRDHYNNTVFVWCNGLYYLLNPASHEATLVRPSETDSYDSKNEYTYLGNIVVPEKVPYDGIDYVVTTIGSHAFEGCKLGSITLPNTLTLIDDYGFYKSNLQHISLPNSIKKINQRAFQNCEYLQSIDMPDELTEIVSEIFLGSPNLSIINFPSDKPIKALGNDISYLPKTAKVVVAGKTKDIPEQENSIPTVIVRDYGNFYWKKGPNGVKNLYNKNNKLILSGNSYDRVSFQNCIIINKNGKYGAISYTGKQIAPPIYNKFEGSGMGRLLFTNPTNTGFTAFVIDAKTGGILCKENLDRSYQYSNSRWIIRWFGDYFSIYN